MESTENQANDFEKVYGDDDGNENVKGAIGLDWQNDSFAHASRFFLHFFAVVARLRREPPNFKF